MTVVKQLACIAVFMLSGSACVHAADSIKISKLDREIRINHQLVVVTEDYEVSNIGKAAVNDLQLCSSSQYAAAAAFTEITVGNAEDAPVLKFEEGDASNPAGNHSCLTVHLNSPLSKGKSVDLSKYTVHTDLMAPFPKQASQSDPQRVLMSGNAYASSPCSISTQTTKVRLPSSTILSLSGLAPTKKAGKVLIFGPYQDLPASSSGHFTAHFENNNAFPRVTQLTRELEVSHWGNVYVDEKYYIKNAAAEHKGTWSRLDLQKNQAGFSKFALHKLIGILPAQAHNLYFRDEIGNISSSNIRFGPSSVQAELRPRFPLYGGWKTEFTFGYSLPLGAIMTKSKGTTQLEALFGSPFDNVVIDDLTVKVILPEGASNIKAKVPFPVDQTQDIRQTYLDTTGRPVVVLHKRNAVPDHEVPFTVTYTFTRLLMLREPVMLITVFALLFASVVAYSRCEFTISRDEKWQADRQQEKAVAVVQQIATVIAERQGAVKSLEYALAAGTDAAEEAKIGVEATLQRTSEQLRTLEQKHEQIGGSASRHSALSQLREKESALQASAMQLYTKRAKDLKEGASIQDIDSKLSAQIRNAEESRKEVVRLTDALLTST